MLPQLWTLFIVLVFRVAAIPQKCGPYLPSFAPTISLRRRGDKASSGKRKAESPLAGSPAKRLKSPGSQSASRSFSEGSWNGYGFTSSSSPSTWGQKQSSEPASPARGEAEITGPAVIRTRVASDGFRRFEEHKNALHRTKKITDPSQLQTAVYARRGGTGRVSAKLSDSRRWAGGEELRVVVDARKSKHDGWIHFGGADRPEIVQAGTKDWRWADGKGVNAFVHGPGKAKITAKNQGWSDGGTTSDSREYDPSNSSASP